MTRKLRAKPLYRCANKALLVLISITLVFSLILNVHSASLSIFLDTDKQLYSMGEEVNVFGNVTLDSATVSDALVAIETDDPKGNIMILRTQPTGNVSNDFTVEMLSVIPCDQGGSPKNSFERGKLAYFRLTFDNNGSSPQYGVVALTVLDAMSVPFEALMVFRGLIYPGTTEFVVSIGIPLYVSLGDGFAYAGVYTELPKNGGVAYSPEKAATFLIANDGSGKVGEAGNYPSATSINSEVYPANAEGTFSVNFRLPRFQGKLGNYTIYASTMYQGENATSTTTFQTFLEGDLNGDKKVDMRDIGIVARAFGSTPGDPAWDPVADVNDDDKVDMRDIGIVARNFGANAS